MDPEKLTARTREALVTATNLAREHNHASVMPAHLGLALLGQPEGIVYPLLDRLGVSALDLRRTLESRLDGQPHVYGDAEIGTSNELSRVLTEADRHRTSMNDDYLSVEHLLLALADSLGLDEKSLRSAIEEVRGGRRVTTDDPESTLDALEQYGRDLTAVARQGKLDPVIGR
ncbi:MAG: Clp protease N-terminal domain-containing protein, partial [Acidimicrobiia bacterium]